MNSSRFILSSPWIIMFCVNTNQAKASSHLASISLTLNRRPSDLLPRPGTLLQRFHDLVNSHDVDAVSHFLTQHGPDELDLNGQNYQGHAALHLAVISEDQAMVERLLDIRPRLAVGQLLDSVIFCVFISWRDNRAKLSFVSNLI